MGRTAPDRAPGPYDTRRADRREKGAGDGVADELIRQAPHRPASEVRLTPVPSGRGPSGKGGHGGA